MAHLITNFKEFSIIYDGGVQTFVSISKIEFMEIVFFNAQYTVDFFYLIEKPENIENNESLMKKKCR